MLGIIIVSYKNSIGTISFLKKQLSKIRTPFKAAVVNVCSTPTECRHIASMCQGEYVEHTIEKESDIFVLCSPDNIGYAKGNNLGVEFLTTNFTLDYLLFSNDDIELLSFDAVHILQAKLAQDREIGMIGPRVIGLDGRDQSPHQTPVSIFRQVGWNLFPFLRRSTRKTNTNRTEPQSCWCYWVSGCFFMIRTEVFVQAGMFDSATFLYYEEAILAEKLKALGYKSFFEPLATVLHYEGATTEKSFSNRIKENIQFASGAYYYRKYRNVSRLMIKVWQMSRFVNRIYR